MQCFKSTVSQSTDSESSVRPESPVRNTRYYLMHLCRGNPLTVAGRRIQMIRMLTLTILPTFALVVLAVVDLNTKTEKLRLSEHSASMVRLSIKLGEVIHYMQQERGYSAMHIISSQDDEATTNYGQTRILAKESFSRTDSRIKDLSPWPGDTGTKLSKYNEYKEFQTVLEDFRFRLIYQKELQPTIREEMDFYNMLIDIFIDWLYRAIQFSEEGESWKALVAYQLLIISKNDIGIERTLGSVFYLLGSFRTHEEYVWYLSSQSVGIGNLEACQLFAPSVTEALAQRLNSYTQWNVTENISQMRDEISRNNITSVSSFAKSTWWFDNMTIVVDSLFDIQMDMAHSILVGLEKISRQEWRDINVSISLVCVFTLLAPLIIFSVRILLMDIQKYATSLSEQTKELSRERKRAESLLYQMLPQQVAQQLKQNSPVPAESYEDVTIFFSDIVGFTTIAASCSPMEVVDLLNSLYSCFDKRLELYDVYKVETIGDSYMVSSGVPHRNGRRHVSEIATMALDLAHHSAHLEIPHIPGRHLSQRAGVHTGPVVAGVVGSKMPRYCLFGDTVNTASRMESTGSADSIQLSTATYSALDALGGFTLECRGQVDIKGKGMMQTYWLLDKIDFEQKFPCMPGCSKFSKVQKTRISMGPDAFWRNSVDSGI